MNPERSGIVSKASDYLYSRASNYVSKSSLIDVTLADIPILDVIKSSGYGIDIGMWQDIGHGTKRSWGSYYRNGKLLC